MHRLPTRRFAVSRLLCAAIIVLFSCTLPLSASATPPVLRPQSPDSPDQAETSTSTTAEGKFGISVTEARRRILNRGTDTGGSVRASSTNSSVPSPFRYRWDPASEFTGCTPDLTPGRAWTCTPHADSCEASTGTRLHGIGDALFLNQPTGNTRHTTGQTQRGTRTNTTDHTTTDLGLRCARPTPSQAPATSDGAPAAEPVVITVTEHDFRSLPITPLHAHAGPERGWLPVNMPAILHTTPTTQELTTQILNTPVRIRAIPVSYHWDLGDGNTITTTNPGNPYPAETITTTYQHEGWYDITLTTTFRGEYSINNEPWQHIDGTIDIPSTPIPLYSTSLESRLTNPHHPTDPTPDPPLPPRTPDTQGPPHPNPTHRTI